MILSENSSTLGSRCCSAARSETEWQRNESWKVRRLAPPKLNMRPERRPLRVGVPQGGGLRVRVRATSAAESERTDRHIILGPTHGLAYRCLRRLVRSFYAFHGLPA